MLLLVCNQGPDFAKRCCRQREEAQHAEEATKRAREAEGERARRAAYSEALRREADRISAILAKQVRCALFRWHPDNTGKCLGSLPDMRCAMWPPFPLILQTGLNNEA